MTKRWLHERDWLDSAARDGGHQSKPTAQAICGLRACDLLRPCHRATLCVTCTKHFLPFICCLGHSNGKRDIMCKQAIGIRSESFNNTTSWGGDTNVELFHTHDWLGLTWCVSPARQGFTSPLQRGYLPVVIHYSRSYCGYLPVKTWRQNGSKKGERRPPLASDWWWSLSDIILTCSGAVRRTPEMVRLRCDSAQLATFKLVMQTQISTARFQLAPVEKCTYWTWCNCWM